MNLKKKLIICGTAIAVIGATIFCAPVEKVDFPIYVDPIMEVTLEEESPPLGNPEVTTKITKKKTTKKVKLKKASKKTYTKKLATTTKTSSNTAESGNKVITTEKKVVTSTVEKYTKKKKYKKVTKTVTTTIKTTTSIKATDNVSAVASSKEVDDVETVETVVEKYEVDAGTLAPKMDGRVISAYKTLGFKVYVDPSITSYSGYFDAKNQTITLRSEDSTVYHELGHFLAFIANNYDRSSKFSKVYSAEKELYTGVNKIYVTQSVSEYFAESVRDYITSPDALKAARPQTYAAIETCLDTITNTQIARIQKIYGAYWK